MSIPGTDLDNMGGRFLTELGALMTTNDVNNMGEIGLQTLLGFLSLLFYDNGEDIPVSGFPHSAPTDGNCLAVTTGDLTYDVGAGWGLIHDPAQIGADPWTSNSYQIAVNKVSTAGPALAAHHATLPRKDLITFSAFRDPQESTPKNIKDPGTGALSVDPGVFLKNSLGGTIAVVTGTPAVNPQPPALPAGALLVATAIVPAAAGAAVIEDGRQILAIGNFVKGAPGSHSYLLDHVVPASPSVDLVVSAPGGMTVLVAAGKATIGGITRHYPSLQEDLTASDPVDPRIDRVIAKRDGTLDILAGTPAPAPAAPALPAQAITLALIDVAALAVAIVGGDITDGRKESWMSGAGVRDATLRHQAMITPPWVVVPTGTSNPDADTKQITYEVQYPDGSPYDGAFPLQCVVQCHTVAVSISTYGGGAYVPSSGTVGYHAAGSPEMAEGLPADMILFPYTGIDNDSPYAITAVKPLAGMGDGRMKGKITAQEFKLEVARATATSPTGTVLVAVHPMGESGAPLSSAAWQDLVFV